MAQSAFNKILELNHRHSEKRFTTGVFLLQKAVGKGARRQALNKIAVFTEMNYLRNARENQMTPERYHFNKLHSNITSADATTNMIGPYAKSQLNNLPPMYTSH